MAEKQLLTTLTGELYQPVRLHYGLCDKTQLTKIFKRLRCLDYDKSQGNFKKSIPKFPNISTQLSLALFLSGGKSNCYWICVLLKGL
jgi:hypothetical protein